MGWTQWATAAERPPHLTCMVSTSAAGRWQQEIPYTNGCFQLYFGWWVYMVRRRITEFHGMNEIDWDEVLHCLPLERDRRVHQSRRSDVAGHDGSRHPRRLLVGDPLRRPLSDDGRSLPARHGWYDLEDLLGAFHHYEGMMAKSPARERQRLIAGPWSHVNSRNPHSSYAEVECGPKPRWTMDDIHLAWFDYWLKDAANGVMETPPARLWETGSHRWRDADHWPLATGERTLYLSWEGDAGPLSTSPSATQNPDRSYRYDPLDPVPTRMDVKRYLIEDVPVDMTEIETRSDVVTYTSEPLDETIVISGWPQLELWASSDRDDTEWHVKLTDVDENGRSIKVCRGVCALRTAIR